MANISPKLDLDEEILRCQMAAKRLWAIQPDSSNQYKQQQMAEWLMELKRLREEVAGLRSNWHKCAESLKKIREERDAAVADLRKLVPAWEYDNNDQSAAEPTTTDKHIEFG